MAKNQPIVLSGRVYCSWNAFTFVHPVPDRLQTGDLVIWSWSGDSRKPSSNSKNGLLRVSVFDGKKRRTLRVKHSRVHRLLSFHDEGQRETHLSALVRELRALKGRSAEHTAGGYTVAPVEEQDDNTAAAETAGNDRATDKRSAAGAQPSQPTLF